MDHFYNRVPKVDGFSKISFWREEEIGIIALLYPGKLGKDTVEELIKAISLASVDDKISGLVITGTNGYFSEGLLVPQRIAYADFRDYYQTLMNLIFVILSFDKPLISLVAGKAKNNGISLALLSDQIIVSENSKFIWDNNEPFVLLSTISFKDRVKIEGNGLHVQSLTVKDENALGDGFNLSKSIVKMINPNSRKYRFSGYYKVILEEEVNFLDFYLWCEKC
ncbi:MAG: enoyl-CoA hydratase-related protein [Thermoplasmatales archaeon]